MVEDECSVDLNFDIVAPGFGWSYPWFGWVEKVDGIWSRHLSPRDGWSPLEIDEFEF